MMHPDFTKPFQWILSNRHRWLFHVLFWVFIYLDELLSFFYITYPLEAVHLLLIEIPADFALVYVNLYILIPYFLLKRNIWYYISLTLLTIYVNVGLMLYLYFDWTCTDCDFLSDTISLFVTNGTLVGTAAGIKIFKIFVKNQQKIQELENAQLTAELTYLKNQINPHFLFNVLNNIYVQSKITPEKASDSILLISDLLRYQLYDCSKEKVSLDQEIKYLQNYLQLDKLRRDESFTRLEVEGNPNGIQVAPFLFLPFVENALKHSGEKDGSLFIKVLFHINPEKLRFQAENSTASGANGPKGPGGIGLENVKRRLELLYPDRHQLLITQMDSVFKVELSLDLRQAP